MKAIIYKNTKTPPIISSPIHETHSIGIAYSKDDFFIHLYGKADGLYIVSAALTTIEKSNLPIEEWIKKSFGAEDILSSVNLVGKCNSRVWRPGLYFQNERNQALEIDEHEQMAAKQALRILINKLDELFL